jgi:feruloyl-CoA synthase
MTHVFTPAVDPQHLTEGIAMSRPETQSRLRFAPAAVTVTPLPDGGMHLVSPLPLQSYPARVSDMLYRWAKRAPDRAFIAERAQVDGRRTWRQITYAQMLDAVRSVGQALLDRGLSVDRPVAILSGNGVDHAIVSFAAMHVGVPVVPISPAYSLTSKAFTKLRHVLDQTNPGLIFVADWERFAPALRVIAPAAEIVVGGARPDGIAVTTLAELCSTPPREAVDEANARVGPDTLAKILFSSGSTGMPKGVINTQRMMCANQIALAQIWPFLPERPPVMLDWLPWHHVFGGNLCTNLVLFHGGTMYIDDGAPSPQLIGRTIANLRDVSPTLYLNVPLAYDMLLPHLEQDAELRERFFAELDFMFFGAASMPVPMWQRLERLGVRTRGAVVPMLAGWGATETGVGTAVHFELERTSVIGLPLPGCELKLVPNKDKLELRIRGPNVTPGYWRRDDLTSAAFDEDGFLRIGDAGRLADDAHPSRGVEFAGRIVEDFKLSSGTWVSPGQVRIRAMAAGAPVIQDAVITGHDRADIGLLIVPSEQGCRGLCPEVPATAPLQALLVDPRVRQCVEEALTTMLTDTGGSSMHPVRALLMHEPLSGDDNEITEKGYVNQRAVLERRSELVDRLYAEVPDSEVITAPDKRANRSHGS